MSFRSYLILMSLATLVAWIAWVVVLHRIDPSRSGFLGFLLFYLTFTVAVFGTFCVFGMLSRLWREKDQILSRTAITSVRQGILLSMLISGSLVLFSQNWFRWWTMVLFVLIVGMLEMVFITTRKP